MSKLPFVLTFLGIRIMICRSWDLPLEGLVSELSCTFANQLPPNRKLQTPKCHLQMLRKADLRPDFKF